MKYLSPRARLAPLALSLSLAYGLPAAPAWAQQKSTPEVVEQPRVVVTGSRISRIAAEGANPVTVITAADIARQGFVNVFDVLQAQAQNTGVAQGADQGNTWTPAANVLNLRGLGPNHTLTLINGRRIADYPTPYDGSINVVNLANIPAVLIDRVEILNGGASAVYGSDAIAGVVNIILKKHVDGYTVNLKAGTTTDGGGQNARLQFLAPIDLGKLQGVFSAEFSAKEPVWGRSRDFMADRTLRGAKPTVVFGRKEAESGKYIEPGAGVCEGLGYLFEGTVKRVPSGKAGYCASGVPGVVHWTLQTQNRSLNLGSTLSYEVSPSLEFFGDALLGFNALQNNTRGPSWTSAAANGGYFRNAKTNTLEVWTRYIAPEEYGGVEHYNKKWNDVSATVTGGVRGELTGTQWGYEASYSASTYRSKLQTPRLRSGVDSLFLGPLQGTDADGISIYAPDPKRLFTPLTPAEFNSVFDRSVANDKTWIHNLSATANGPLVDLPAGPLRAAVLAEVGSQGFSNEQDARLPQGYFYNTKGGVDYKGTRGHYAVGAELNAPLHKTLTASLATRYDGYRFAGRKDGKGTYNLGLEFRPLPELLLRGNSATSFRAPDMNYVFSAQTKGYYSSTTDYYRCAKANQPIATCEFAKIAPGFNYEQGGNKSLKPESGRSSGLGLVWSPSSDFDVSLDFWKVKIDQLVTNLDEDRILREEADCRLGKADINSASCQDTLRRVVRNPLTAVIRPGEVNYIVNSPLNASLNSTHGFDLEGKYRWKVSGYGDFSVTGKFTKVQSYKERQFPNDPILEKVRTRDLPGWPNKLVATVTWNLQPWTNTLTFTRTGAIPDSDKGWIAATTLVNLNSTFELNPKSKVALSVNNLFGKVPKDPAGAWPFYPTGQYSALGRQIWLEFNQQF